MASKTRVMELISDLRLLRLYGSPDFKSSEEADKFLREWCQSLDHISDQNVDNAWPKIKARQKRFPTIADVLDACAEVKAPSNYRNEASEVRRTSIISRPNGDVWEAEPCRHGYSVVKINGKRLFPGFTVCTDKRLANACRNDERVGSLDYLANDIDFSDQL